MGTTYKKNQVTGRRVPKQTSYPITIGNGVTNWGRFNADQSVTTDSIFSRQTINTQTVTLFDSATYNGVTHVIYMIDDGVGANSLYYTNNTGGTWAAATLINNTVENASIIVGNESPTPYISIVYSGGQQLYITSTPYNAIAFPAATSFGYGAGGTSRTNIRLAVSPTTRLLHVSFNRSAGDAGVYHAVRSTSLPAAGTWTTTTIVAVQYSHAVAVSTTDVPYVIVDAATNIEVYNTTPAIEWTLSTTATDTISGRRCAYIGSDNILNVLVDDTANNILYNAAVSNLGGGGETQTNTNIYTYTGAQANSTLAFNTATNKLHVAISDQENTIYATNESGAFVTQVVDASSYSGSNTALKPSIGFENNSVKIVYYDDVSNVFSAPRLLFSNMTSTQSRKYNISTALNNAISSLPNGGQIEILNGSYYLDNTITIITDNIKILGDSSIVNIDPTQFRLIVSANGVSISHIQLQNVNPITYTNAAQSDMEPMIELLPSSSSSCTVEFVTFSGVDSDSVEKDIEWTIADGHIVNNNISTTAVSGLGGI